jgi:membrane-associated PAP2 superfamily phosphatase
MKRLIALLFVSLGAAGYTSATPARAVSAPPAGSVSPASSITVFISGLRRINSSAYCTWDATASGGTAPYTYSWSTVNGGGTGYGETWYGHFPSSGTLTVVVTDALGATGTSTINVTSIYNGPLCP